MERKKNSTPASDIINTLLACGTRMNIQGSEEVSALPSFLSIYLKPPKHQTFNDEC